MLFWHKHNVEKALGDLANFTPFPDEWTVEDKVLFEQAFSFHGKSFHRIRQMVSFFKVEFYCNFFDDRYICTHHFTLLVRVSASKVKRVKLCTQK
jgi:hypothetical protein